MGSTTRKNAESYRALLSAKSVEVVNMAFDIEIEARFSDKCEENRVKLKLRKDLQVSDFQHSNRRKKLLFFKKISCQQEGFRSLRP